MSDTTDLWVEQSTGDGSWRWLESTEKLQIESYGNDLRSVSGEDRARHIAINVLAATDELHEALAETEWKPWSSKQGGVNKEKFLGEMVDTLHFVANLLVLGDITEDELWTAYRAKQIRNQARMARPDGYDAQKNRCDGCKRELDRPGAYRLLGQEYYQETVGDGSGVDMMRYTLECACKHISVLELKVGEELP